jgi:Putative beta-barrel porin 2
MKKFIVSLGLAAAGTASLQAAYAPDANSMQATKIWSVSSTLRGFYDDNYATSPNGQKKGSGGYEVSPTLSLNVPLQQTEIGLRYTYGLYYYQQRRDQGNDPYDQSHQVDLWVDHAFTERWQVKVADTMAIGQEPALLNPGGGANANPYRVTGNNLANNGNVRLTTDWTRLFSTVLTYNNGYYNYQNSGTTIANLASQGASQSALLNRIEQSVALDLQWHVAPETIALVGYEFDWVDYTGNQPIAQDPINLTHYYYSDSRNSRSDKGYVGFQRNWLPNLNTSARVGVQYTDNYTGSSPNTTTPYAVTSASYTYSPGSYVQIGVTHEENATDVVAPNTTNGHLTQSQQSTVLSASVNQQLAPKLLGTVIGNIQYSTFNQGAYNNDADVTYGIGLNLSYAFTQHFSGEIGYNFDDLQSNIPGRAYSRNRVYLGVTAAY